jgi:hypothetical protein
MCDICHSEGRDYRFKNGTKNYLTNQALYKVFKNSVAPVRVCYVHGIELFTFGEKRFLREHLPFARILATRSRKLSIAEDGAFGF